ncbi:hypothetical protein [Methylobacterium sp. J-090]|uniref:hypothetical protein n=1 Tax=Methylobacterium sp. J-090 TaxID=2836666 RepID=UPI001FB98C32|nr:hypothetical protein [Methylobacterium sp. J-090]MCJ2083044.1 hypothetical protein [Methylobacterium sp. J-090]
MLTFTLFGAPIRTLDRSMLFLVRAAVVIGGLSYLAMHRDLDSVPSLPKVPVQALVSQTMAAPVRPVQALAAAWDAMPADARERMVRDGTDALVRHLGTTRPVSADTLADADRRPPWRGVASR